MTPKPAEYVHPRSGRIYREGDPAHRFAQLVAGVARQCEEFGRYVQPLLEADYLDQRAAWMGDCERITRSLARTIEQIEEAHTDVVVDRDYHRYGLGTQDDEWQRKYGAVPADATTERGS
jgi:hypothetical protein